MIFDVICVSVDCVVYRSSRRGRAFHGKWRCFSQVQQSRENVAHKSTAAAEKGEQVVTLYSTVRLCISTAIFTRAVMTCQNSFRLFSLLMFYAASRDAREMDTNVLGHPRLSGPVIG